MRELSNDVITYDSYPFFFTYIFFLTIMSPSLPFRFPLDGFPDISNSGSSPDSDQDPSVLSSDLSLDPYRFGTGAFNFHVCISMQECSDTPYSPPVARCICCWKLLI